MLNNGNIMKKIIFFLCLMSSIVGVNAQSIYRSWNCDTNLCMNLNQNGYSSISELENVKIKIQGNKLKVMSFYMRGKFLGGKSTYWFRIEKLTNDTLILTQNAIKNQFEHIPKDTTIFISIPQSCTDR